MLKITCVCSSRLERCLRLLFESIKIGLSRKVLICEPHDLCSHPHDYQYDQARKQHMKMSSKRTNIVLLRQLSWGKKQIQRKVVAPSPLTMTWRTATSPETAKSPRSNLCYIDVQLRSSMISLSIYRKHYKLLRLRRCRSHSVICDELTDVKARKIVHL